MSGASRSTAPPGGGYVLNTVHNIQAAVPPQNIVAMIEALRDGAQSKIRHLAIAESQITNRQLATVHRSGW
jgi:hypothetical protein